MLALPIIEAYSAQNLQKLLLAFSDIIFLSKEERKNFSADFPLHNRYFSSGDKPLVAFVKLRGYAALRYLHSEFVLLDNQMIFFDDNIPHAWVMRDCDLHIYYYRCEEKFLPIDTGDYCQDKYV